uniref:Uncharacterized protein n=1 Tax=Panagrolaimus sp. PS1159 TaxID=55785 RepID=A0AC35G4U0_9BILA
MGSMGSMGSMSGGYNNMLLNPYMDSMPGMGGINGYGAMTSLANPMSAAIGGMGGLGGLAMSPYSAYGGYGMGNPYGRNNNYSKSYGTPSNNNLNNGLQATGSGGSYRPQPSGNCGGRRCAWETVATKN